MVARATPPHTRRAALAGLLAVPAVLLPLRANADILPDDDEEDLIEKAKANRAQRLAENKVKSRKLVAAEGLTDNADAAADAAAQNVVNAVVKAGAALAANDAANAAAQLSVVSGSFDSALNNLSATMGAKQAAVAAEKALDTLYATVQKGDVAAGKAAYVEAAAALSKWAKAAGVAGQLRYL